MKFSTRCGYFSILLVPLLLGISAGDAVASGSSSDDDILIVLCELTGEDPGQTRVTEVLKQWLDVIYSDYDNVTVERSDLSITFNPVDYSDGSAIAYAEGLQKDADVVLWGAYMVEGTRVRIALITQLTCMIYEDPVLGAAPEIFSGDDAFPISDIAPSENPPELFTINAYQALAWIYSYRGDTEETLALLNRALDLSDYAGDITISSLLSGRAELYLVAFDQPELALNDINIAFELFPESPSIILLREQILARLESGEAPEYSEPIDTEDGSLDYYFSRAVALDLAGRFEEALEYYNAAIEVGGTDAELSSLYNDRSLCYSYLGDNDAALADAELSIELNPENGWGYARLSELADMNGDYVSALDFLHTAISIEPDNPYFLGNRARVYFFLDNNEAAIADARASVELDPGDSDIHYLLATIYAESGDFENAIDSYTAAIEHEEQRGDLATYLAFRATCYAELGYIDSAYEDFEDAIEMDSNCGSAYFYRGVINYLLEQYPDAAWDFRKVLEISDNPNTRADVQMYLDEMGY